MLNINQAATIIVVMILFTSAGGLTVTGYDLLKVSVASAIAGVIIVMIADFLYSIDGGTL